MISFGKSASFAFSKRSFIIGSVLLFLTLLLVIIATYTLHKLGPAYSHMLKNISDDTWYKIGYILYGLKVLCSSVLFTYFFILAKKLVYNQSTRFSGEFFGKVLLVIFSFRLLVDLCLYEFAVPLRRWLQQKIFMIAVHPDPVLIIKSILMGFGISILISYCIAAFYMSYLIHFNFSRFFFKLRYALSSPLTFFKMMGWSLLFILLSLVPIIAFRFVLGSFSARDVMMTFLPCFMGTSASLGLLFYTILVGLPIAIFCCTTTGGRILGLSVTLWYFILYGVLRMMGMPAIPVSAVLYVYVFFFIINLLYVTFFVVYPAFFIHMLAQGTLEINQKFDSSIGVSEEEKLLATSTINLMNQGTDENSLIMNKGSSNVVSNNNISIGNGSNGGFLKVIIILLIILGTIVGIAFSFKTHQPEIRELPYKNSGIKVKYLNGEMLAFLQRYYPASEKRLVVYYPDPNNIQLPISPNFTKVLTEARNNGEWQTYYDFVPQGTRGQRMSVDEAKKEAKRMADFANDICGIVCIIDTQEKWVFNIKSPDLLAVSLEEFKK